MKNNKTIDFILTEHKEYLGRDFNKYRNHVYRVFALCLELDKSPDNEEKYAIASAFHDLGIWTNRTFDYLRPSITIAREYLSKVDKSNWDAEISIMIDMHHKKSKYTSSYQKTVETFRRADWIDVTRGRMSFGVEKSKYQRITEAFPYVGFHSFLLIQTVKHFFVSPANPLPMLKK